MDKDWEPLPLVLEKVDDSFEAIANKVQVTPRYIYKIKNRQVEATGDTELAIRNYINYGEAAPKRNKLDQVKDLCSIISNILRNEEKNSASKYVVGVSLLGALKMLDQTPKYITDGAIHESYTSNKGLKTINIIPAKIMRSIVYDNRIFDKESLFDFVEFASQKMIMTKFESQKILSRKADLFDYFYKKISINNVVQNWEDLAIDAYEWIRINTLELDDKLKNEFRKEKIVVLKNIFSHLNIKTVDEILKIISIDVRDAEDILYEIKREESKRD
jgi:hypothetical protein